MTCGADGCTNDQTIAGECRGFFSIHEEIKLDDVVRRSRADDHLVEAKVRPAVLGSSRLTLEHHVARDAVIARCNLSETTPEVVRIQIGQEPEFAEIDAQDGNLVVAHLSGGPQNCSIAAQDDQTFTINWKQPYYLADALGLRVFWPLPAHLLEADYASMVEGQNDSLGFLSRPYWTSEYVHIGPFKLAEFTPGVSAAFDAVDDYFLGRPRVDRIVVTQFADPSTLLANVLSGAIDLGPDGVMEVEQAVELKDRWDRDGGGKIYFGTGTTQFVSVQFDASVPDYQTVIADRRVREALYQAIDRDAYADVASAGIPDKGAYALLPPDNPLYSYVRDGWKQRYPYDVTRAAAIFEEAGWRRGADGLLANGAAGQHLRLETRNTAGMDQRSAVMVQIKDGAWMLAK